jgi:DNA-binding NtrC family response regulator
LLSPRLTLVNDDQCLVKDLRAFLRGHLAWEPPVCPLADAAGQPAPGLLVVAAGATTDPQQVAGLVAEVVLRVWPLTVLLVEGEAACPGLDLDFMGPHLPARLRWPADAPALLEWIRVYGAAGGVPVGAPLDEPTEHIRCWLEASTPSLLPLVQPLRAAARHDVTLLLSGETGTGKTSVARLIHACSPRRHEPFITVPCGALAANLIESELFGHERGAFTGADRAKIGKFELAGGGTLLLDEIDTLGLEQQAKLLRVVETGEYEPVGSNATQLNRARLIVASNQDLEAAVRTGAFREDLWYRLNVMSLVLPPLRERVRDIAPLARTMAARFARKFRKLVYGIAPEVLRALESYPWPGNLRQLENVIQQALLVCKGPRLLPQHLPESVGQATRGRNGGSVGEGDPECRPDDLGPASLGHALACDERALIQKALANHGDNRSRAARALGISRVTLYKKMRKYGLQQETGLPAG